jgi:ABC-type transport system involved in Fe-S cluster assembly fused permease/ATPase subunit
MKGVGKQDIHFGFETHMSIELVNIGHIYIDIYIYVYIFIYIYDILICDHLCVHICYYRLQTMHFGQVFLRRQRGGVVKVWLGLGFDEGNTAFYPYVGR